MDTCKIGDYGGIKRFNLTLTQRKLLFYIICIPLRLLIAYMAYKLADKTWFYVLIVIATGIMLNKAKYDKTECVWWKRSVHENITTIIFVTAIIQLLTKNRKPIIAALLLADVTFGFISSILQRWTLATPQV